MQEDKVCGLQIIDILSVRIEYTIPQIKYIMALELWEMIAKINLAIPPWSWRRLKRHKVFQQHVDARATQRAQTNPKQAPMKIVYKAWSKQIIIPPPTL